MCLSFQAGNLNANFTPSTISSQTTNLSSVVMTASSNERWPELGNGCSDPEHKCKGHCHPKLSRHIRTRLSATFIFLFLLFVWWQFNPPATETPQLTLARGQSSVEMDAKKYAIVTFESRQATYWKESLGNKLTYARRHGYSPFSKRGLS